MWVGHCVIGVSQDRFSFNYLHILPPQGYLKESSVPSSSVIFNLKFISSMADWCIALKTYSNVIFFKTSTSIASHYGVKFTHSV